MADAKFNGPRPVGKPQVGRVRMPGFGHLWRYEVLDIDAHRCVVGYRPSWEAAIRGAVKQRDLIASGWGVDTAPPDPDEFQGGCGLNGCRCADPSRWPVCGEWMGIDGETGPGCPRCGWSRRVHSPAESLLSAAVPDPTEEG